MSSIERLSDLLVARGYRVDTSPVPARVLLTRPGRGLGPFFPFIDFVFIHDCGAGFGIDGAALRRLHEQARAYAESQFRLPRPMRYKIPVTMTFGVSDTGFDEASIAFARESKLRSQWDGGEKNSVFLFDMPGRRFISAGLETTYGRYGSTSESPVNPTNRVHAMVEEITDELFDRR